MLSRSPLENEVFRTLPTAQRVIDLNLRPIGADRFQVDAEVGVDAETAVQRNGVRLYERDPITREYFSIPLDVAAL